MIIAHIFSTFQRTHKCKCCTKMVFFLPILLCTFNWFFVFFDGEFYYEIFLIIFCCPCYSSSWSCSHMHYFPFLMHSKNNEQTCLMPIQKKSCVTNISIGNLADWRLNLFKKIVKMLNNNNNKNCNNCENSINEYGLVAQVKSCRLKCTIIHNANAFPFPLRGLNQNKLHWHFMIQSVSIATIDNYG